MHEAILILVTLTGLTDGTSVMNVVTQPMSIASCNDRMWTIHKSPDAVEGELQYAFCSEQSYLEGVSSYAHPYNETVKMLPKARK